MKATPFLLLTGWLLGTLLMTGCKSGTEKKNHSTSTDSTLVEPAAINNLFLDSLSISYFAITHSNFTNQVDRIHKFYKKRNYQYAWFNNDGLIEQAGNFMNMLSQYSSEGISDSTILTNSRLVHVYDSIAFGNYPFHGADTLTSEAELLLTAVFLQELKHLP